MGLEFHCDVGEERAPGNSSVKPRYLYKFIFAEDLAHKPNPERIKNK